jgi:HPt (histidine-containing phosphotransfer) domain-containing protein
MTDREQAMAFARPGGEVCRISQKSPVDLDHLARQTFGDRDLQGEVLNLFVRQAAGVRTGMREAAPEERRRLAHGLRGAAASVGAFVVAERARALEERPEDRSRLRRLADAIEDVRDFIAAISR